MTKARAIYQAPSFICSPLPTRHRQSPLPLQVKCNVPPPRTYEKLHAEATASAQACLAAGHSLVEIQFPAVPNMATAALNELLDANRAYARDLVRSFVPRTPREKLHVVFPDVEEARLAVRAYGDVNFTVRALPKQRPLYVREGGVAIVVQPGFNVSEWMEIENLEGMPIITVNADLDKVRSSYYPRLFYPGLYKVKERFLSRFEEAYYIKMFANGGTLMRRFPDGWRLFYAALDGLKEVWSGQSRPEPRMVERLLAECRRKEYI